MSSRSKPPTLDYAGASQISPSEKLAPFRWLFWPVGAAIFLLTFLGLAGNGAAAGVYEAIVHLPVLGAWLLSAYGWGALLKKGTSLFFNDQLKKSDVPFSLVDVTILAAGLGAMSLAILGFGLIGLFNRPVAFVMVLIGVGIAVAAIVKRKSKLTPHVGFGHWPWLLMTPSLAMVILCALLPAGLLWGMDEPNGYDVVEYHLQVPREWFESGHIVALHHNVYSFFPFNVEMHYLLGMHLMGGPWAGQFLAQLMHAAYMALFVVAVYATVRPWGQGRAMIAAMLAAAPPWVPLLASIAYDEGGFLLYGTLAIGWALRTFAPSPGTPGEGGVRVLPRQENDSPVEQNPHPTLSRRTGRGAMAIAGVMAGLAAGCKLTAVPLILVGIPVAVLLIAPRQWKGVAVFCVAGLLTFSPWLTRNAVWARGNPVFPEMQSVLGRAHFSQEQSDRWYRAHKSRPDQQAMSVRVAELGRQVFADWRFAYAIVPLGVVALAITLRERSSRLLLILLIVLTAFWLLETHLQGRFYIMAIPLAAIALGMLPWHRWPLIAAPMSVLLLLAGTVSTQAKLAGFSRPNANLFMFLGATGDLRPALPQAIEDGEVPVVLVGDATVFWWHLPMSRCYYRTVFDIDTSGGKTLAAAFTKDLTPGMRVFLFVNRGELDRYHRTYGTPEEDDSLDTSDYRVK